MKCVAHLLTLAVVVVPVDTLAQTTPSDSAAIIATALNYLEGWFDGSAVRMTEAVHPEMAKRQVVEGRNGNDIRNMSAMTLVNYTGRPTPRGELPDARDRVLILDIFQNFATVRTDFPDWVDHLQMARVAEGKWRIVNVLWEVRREGG